VIVGDEPVFSCLLPVAACGGRAVRTIEGLGTIEHPGPLQRAFIDQQAAQCGYCIAGMVMRAQHLLNSKPHPTETEIRDGLRANLCRCGTHAAILRAVRRAATS
jgi:aerobic-type carbon monoxide dehydrogenase small subunit (CoxS/CutS family)